MNKNEPLSDEELLTLAKEGEELLGKKEGLLSSRELLETNYPPIEWLVEGLIPTHGFTAITGTPASYKSFLTEHLAICLTQDQSFLGHFSVTPSSVLILDKENSLPLLKERFTKLGLESDSQLFFLEEPDKFKLADEKQLIWLIDLIKQKDIKLLIIDSFVHVHSGEENDSQAIAKTFELLKRIPCAIVFIHHHRKAVKFFTGTPLESIRGSSDIAAELESHLAVDQTNNGLRVAQYKNRNGELAKPFMVTPLITDTTATFEFTGELTEEVKKTDQAKTLILELLKDGEKSRQDLIEALAGSVGENAIDHAIKELCLNNVLISRSEGRRKLFSMSYPMSWSKTLEISPVEQAYLEEAESMS